MGTTWSAHYLPGEGAAAPAEVKRRIQAALDEVNRLASTWDPASELARFNASPGVEPFPVSPALAALTARALGLAEASGGAFDPTIPPLLRLYGFGPGAAQRPPTAEELAGARARIGYRKLRVDDEGRLARSQGDVEVDLSAIAKGYGVDQAGAALAAAGAERFLVEVGGEVLARGRRADGGPWRLGIETPAPGPPGAAGNSTVALLVDQGMATSGDYRQFRDEGAARVHHIIDPRLGTSAATPLTSVSVVAKDCALADALATTVMVMGVEEGVPFATAYAEGVEVYWILRGDDGSFSDGHTPGFPLAR